jgi:hypothetical protein
MNYGIKFCRLCLKLLLPTILRSSLPFYPYQKDERALPGHLLKRCSFFPLRYKAPLAFPQMFSLFFYSYTILSDSLSLSLFGFKGFSGCWPGYPFSSLFLSLQFSHGHEGYFNTSAIHTWRFRNRSRAFQHHWSLQRRTHKRPTLTEKYHVQSMYARNTASDPVNKQNTEQFPSECALIKSLIVIRIIILPHNLITVFQSVSVLEVSD